ncbi:hypothetical protein Tco_0292299 [Tanacetum coccineum]
MSGEATKSGDDLSLQLTNLLKNDQCFELIGYPDWWNDGHKKGNKNRGLEIGKASAANTEGKNHSTQNESSILQPKKKPEDPKLVSDAQEAPNLIPKVSNTHSSPISEPIETTNNTSGQEQVNFPTQEDTSGRYVLPPRANWGVLPKIYSPEKVSRGSRYPIANIAKGNLSEEDKAFALSMYSDEILANTKQALKSKLWKDAMEEEIKALIKNNTWEKRVLTTRKKTVGCRNNGRVLTPDAPTWTPSALNYFTCAYTGCPHLDTLSNELLCNIQPELIRDDEGDGDGGSEVVDVVVVSGEAAAEGWQWRLDGSGGGGAWGSGLSRSGDGESFRTWLEKSAGKLFRQRQVAAGGRNPDILCKTQKVK